MTNSIKAAVQAVDDKSAADESLLSDLGAMYVERMRIEREITERTNELNQLFPHQNEILYKRIVIHLQLTAHEGWNASALGQNFF